jgi:hypothetical protein
MYIASKKIGCSQHTQMNQKDKYMNIWGPAVGFLINKKKL